VGVLVARTRRHQISLAQGESGEPLLTKHHLPEPLGVSRVLLELRLRDRARGLVLAARPGQIALRLNDIPECGTGGR
jgi:hypothetical protein